MRAVVALMLSASILTPGCFPHDSHKRTLAQLIEGGTIAAGIGVEAFVSTGADCDMMTMPGLPINTNCHNHSAAVGGIGVALILAGVLGFIATISTAEDDKPEAPRIDIKAKPQTTDPVTTTAPPTATDPAATIPALPGTTNVAARAARRHGGRRRASGSARDPPRWPPRRSRTSSDRAALAADVATVALADLAAVVDRHVARPRVTRSGL